MEKYFEFYIERYITYFSKIKPFHHLKMDDEEDLPP